MKTKHRHYLRTYRLRSGLKQCDVAFLIGLRGPDQVAKVEAYKSCPSIQLLLACSILYDASIPALIPSHMDELKAHIEQNAQQLRAQLEERPRTGLLERRLATVTRLAEVTRY